MALQQLTMALQSLSKSVSNFQVGAISIDDFKPLEEQIKDTRQTLKVQKAHWMLMNSKQNTGTTTEEPQEDIGTTISNLHEEITRLQINNMTINLCLHSCSIEDIMHNEKPTPDFKKQAQTSMEKLFTLNDNLISLHNAMQEALKNELILKIECQESLFEYRTFLKVQEDIRNKKLQETNPEIIRNKKVLEVKLAKINMMKRLMVNMIATSGDILTKEPFLFEMMKKHRDIINIETITEMARKITPSD